MPVPRGRCLRQPTAASERHTEVVYGEVVTLLGDATAGYVRVRVADTYEGWVATGALARRRSTAAPATPAGSS